MHEIAGEGNDIGKSGALRGQRSADRLEDERALRLEIGRRLAVLVGADLAGDEQIFRSFHAGDVRISRERLGHAVGIETLDRWHGGYSVCAERMERRRMMFRPSVPAQSRIQKRAASAGAKTAGLRWSLPPA